MMKKDYLDIIKEKEFIELNSEERTELAGICATEEEFNSTKAMLIHMDGIAVESITPEPKTKESLDSLFAQTYPKSAPIWYNSVFAVIVPREKPIYRQPLLQVAAAFLIFWMVFPFINTDLSKENKQLAKVEKQQTEELHLEKEAEAKPLEDVITSPGFTNAQSPVSVNESPVSSSLVAESRSFPGSADILTFSSMDLEDEVMVLEESTHPDGIFIGGNSESIAFGQSGNETADLLDLLTATF